jgi:hypothetical protein
MQVILPPYLYLFVLRVVFVGGLLFMNQSETRSKPFKINAFLAVSGISKPLLLF